MGKDVLHRATEVWAENMFQLVVKGCDSVAAEVLTVEPFYPRRCGVLSEYLQVFPELHFLLLFECETFIGQCVALSAEVM